jgi:hypothetical protein
MRDLLRGLAEIVVQVDRIRSIYRVVVWAVFSFEADMLDRIEERTAEKILTHMRLFLPTHGTPWEDPSSEITRSLSWASDWPILSMANS